MFYVYLRRFYHVWEPAEGGYYVTASCIDDYCDEWCLEDAVYELLDTFIQWDGGMNDLEGSWNMGFETKWFDGEPETRLVLPCFTFYGYEGYQYELGISCDKPEDKPYEGYC